MAPSLKSSKPPRWNKAPDDLVKRFSDALAPFPEADRKKMGGYPAAFTNTQMFAGLFEDFMVIRLPAAELEEFKRQGATPFEPVNGRSMKEYAVVPQDILESEVRLRGWLQKSFNYARSLPPKPPKPKTAKPKST
jgi:TfoX/Sxy family transcriptional regulator of competence genes